ncbi:MAG: hypothetical protein JOZ87_26800 [Chloroflexi bacterium]|nr:hypothetical protein [Chloroflexota bacterium]
MRDADAREHAVGDADDYRHADVDHDHDGDGDADGDTAYADRGSDASDGDCHANDYGRVDEYGHAVADSDQFADAERRASDSSCRRDAGGSAECRPGRGPLVCRGPSERGAERSGNADGRGYAER